MSEYNGGQAPGSGPAKRLERTRNGRMIAGVCSGVGKYVGIDPNLVRVIMAVLCVFGGTGALIYVIGWVLMPEEDDSGSIAQQFIDKQRERNNTPTP